MRQGLSPKQALPLRPTVDDLSKIASSETNRLKAQT